ncbi:MAG: hypothetical protein P1V20_05935 [Verrucomicrobiales bacterium]|nr:hypothetical protein [Verrucomicrobiales bacterium]
MKHSCTDQTISDLIDRARREQPFGGPRSYGFQARLRQSIAAANPGTLDYFSIVCWRFSMVCLPILFPALVALAVFNGLHLPPGISSAASLYSDLFSLDFLSFF